MHVHTTPLSFLLLAVSASAQITVDLHQRVVNASLVQLAPSNTSDLQRRQGGEVRSTVATNRFNSYTAAVSVGEPATTYNLLIDNGSANTWIKDYTLTSSSVPTGQNASVEYGIGEYAGQQYLDRLDVAGAVVANQSLSRATRQIGYDDVDGVLAFGPTNLTEWTVTDTNVVPTVLDNLVAQGLVPAHVVGMAFLPVTSVSDNETLNNGRLTLGGVDNTSFIGDITYLPLTEVYPSNMYWGLDCSAMVYHTAAGKATQLTAEPAVRSGIIDSGTTLALLPSDAFRTYVAQLPGAMVNSAGFLAIPDSVVPTMGNFTFTFSGHDVTLSPSAQLFPPEVAAEFGQSKPGFSYSIFGSSGTRTSGLDFYLGIMFLERYYSVYDSDAQRIGFAETIYTHQHTSERASFRKAKRAHNARAHKKQHQYVAAAAAAADVVPSPSNSTSTSSPPSTKRPAVKAKVVDVSAADGKKRRLGALKGLSPFEMVVES